MAKSKDWVMLFGTPGVGKTTVAKEMEKLGYFYHEADDDLLPEVIELNRSNRGLTPELRDRQHKYIFEQIIELTKTHRKLVVAYDFQWDRYRKKLVELCPELRWVYLQVEREILRSRVNRPGHILTPEFALEIADLFEEPTHRVTYIENIGKPEDVAMQIIQSGN